jgi:hypothetical protein
VYFVVEQSPVHLLPAPGKRWLQYHGSHHCVFAIPAARDLFYNWGMLSIILNVKG